MTQSLVKCEKDDIERLEIVGYQSGKRSALLPRVDEPGYIRLKGCGNLTKGFNMQNMVYPPD